MNFLCFDTEDNSAELMAAGRSGFEKKITQIASQTWEGTRYYNKGDANEFKKYLARSGCKYFYAHNLQYDLGALFADKLDDLDVTMVGGRIIKAIWGKHIFVDSFNIWPMALAKVGEAFGVKKLDTGSMATDKDYVWRDVEITHKAMTFAWQFALEMGLDRLPPTLGGLCVKLWRHFGGTNNHDSNQLCRDALYGGRVELFHVCDDETWRLNDRKTIYAALHNELPGEIEDFIKFGKSNVVWTDINSLYPSVMRGRFPTALSEWTGKDLPDYGIVKCRVKQKETWLPVLPYRNKDGRILYPYGNFNGTWTVAELKLAMDNGCTIEKVQSCYGTNDFSTPYKGFVDRLYDMRLATSNDAESLFFKLLMNNLYGRLGTSGVIGRSVWQTEDNKWSGVPYGEKVLVEYKMPLSEETNWCHAAHVTGYGRVAWYGYAKRLGQERLIYGDTDCTVFNLKHTGEQSYLDDNYGTAAIPFTISKELGAMKLEGICDGGIAFAPKMYKFGRTYKAKGVPKRLARQFISSGHAEFDLPFKLREAMRFFDRGNAKKLSVWRGVHKQRQSNYDRKKLVDNTYFPCKVNEN